MRARDELFAALAASAFRSRFKLDHKERAYLDTKGFETILRHADDFIAQKLAPAFPVNDGKQTPMRGHPVFIAQHATATCCRGCLEKWHRIPQGRLLSDAERDYVRELIAAWLEQQGCSRSDRDGRLKPL